MRRTQAGYRYYLCRGRTDALRAAQGQRCTTRYTPAEQLDQLVWSDLCALLGDPAQVAQTLDGDQLVEKLRERLEAGPCHFHVLVPATPLDQLAPHLGYEDPTKGEPMASAEELGRSAARQRLHEELPRLRRLGAEVDGEVGEADLGCRIKEVLSGQQVDEIILSTPPQRRSRWLARDLPSRVQRDFGLPVTHVVSKPGAPV